MTTTTTPRVRKARRDGICLLCRRWISTGQLITRSDHGWVHARCLLPAPPQVGRDVTPKPQTTPPGEAGRGATKGTPQW